MRVRVALICLAATVTGCGRAAVASQAPAPALALQVHDVELLKSPSPLVEVQVGSVRGVVPKDWQARMLPSTAYLQEGFEASPSISDWERGAEGTSGIEAFWIDIDKLGIPSDYYYLAARNVSFGRLQGSLDCQPAEPDIVANHPPDFTGSHFSASDYVASGRGTCILADGSPAQWAYVVAAPGFGPARQVGIPTSGLYVVMAEVSGPHAEQLLKEMIAQASFGDTTVPQLVRAAGLEQTD